MREVLTENKHVALFKPKQKKLVKNDSTNKDIDAVLNTWLYLTLVSISPFVCLTISRNVRKHWKMSQMVLHICL